jgi:hypothetical protein
VRAIASFPAGHPEFTQFLRESIYAYRISSPLGQRPIGFAGARDDCYTSFIKGNLMKLSDIYRKKVELAKQWGIAADSAQGYEGKLQCRENALDLQADASAIAHCIANWGDQEVEQLDIGTLRGETDEGPWQHHNPWHRGLSIMQDELASVRTRLSNVETYPEREPSTQRGS